MTALGRFWRSGARPGEIQDGLSSKASLKPEDRRLMSNLLFGVIRHRRLLDQVIERHLTKPGRLPAVARDILRVGAYQILFCDRIPQRAVLHTAVDLARERSGERLASLVNAVLRKVQGLAAGGRAWIEEMPPALRHSFPDWMVARWSRRFGLAETEALLQAMNRHPPLHLRVNPLLAGRDEAAAILEEEGLPCLPAPHSPLGLIPRGDRPLESLPSFGRGLFSVQDEAFQLIGSLLPVSPGDTILDLFAGLGGKSTLLAQRCRDRARVIAADISRTKLSRLADECRRLSLGTVLPVAADVRRLPFGEGIFDAALLDVPCSATGVIRRHPDIKWSREPGDMRRLPALQRRFLEAAAGTVKPGGYLLYATCSLEEEENESVVMSFLEKCGTFGAVDLRGHDLPHEFVTQEGFFRSFPHRHGTDGAFAALLRRG